MEDNNNINYNSNQPYSQQKPERPQLLTFLCILTFIASGISLLGYISFPNTRPMLETLINAGGLQKEVVEMYEKLLQSPSWHFYVLSFFYAMSLGGAIYMFNLKKVGFHLYAVAQIAILVFTSFVMVFQTLSVFSILGCFLWIAMYGMYYKKMQ